MSKFTLTASEMQNAINEINSANTEFKNRVAELEGEQQNLAGMWQGDANTVFNNAFQNDKGQWSTFANLVDQYVETLGSILQIYQTAESTNVETGKTRTY